MSKPLIPAALTAALVLCATSNAQSAALHEVAVYSFTDGLDGGFPRAGLVGDAAGNLYGTTSSGGAGHLGTVFKLSPPAPGQTNWTETTLHAFTGGDGAVPQASLLLASDGNLYGTTLQGAASGQGVVFRLTPPARGQGAWTETVLFAFTGGNDGGAPCGALIQDPQGRLYGTASEGGTGVVGAVFSLTPPANGGAPWNERVLYNFTGNDDGGEPLGRLVFDRRGNLYGTTAGYGQFNYGTVYQLTRPATGGAWGFALLHAFQDGADGEVPRDGLILNNDGTGFFGTTAGFDTSQGTVFSLVPPLPGATAWTLSTIYTFHGAGFTGNGPWQTVALDSSGYLYGTTLGVGATSNGEVFRLAPPQPGASHWTAKVLHAFQGGADSQFPYSQPWIGVDGALYGTGEGAAGESGFFPGVVWRISR